MGNRQSQSGEAGPAPEASRSEETTGTSDSQRQGDFESASERSADPAADGFADRDSSPEPGTDHTPAESIGDAKSEAAPDREPDEGGAQGTDQDDRQESRIEDALGEEDDSDISTDEQGEGKSVKEPPLPRAEQKLDFCQDPDFRASRDAVERVRDRILQGGQSRLDYVSGRVEQRLADHPELGAISRDGAFAAHAYSCHEIFKELNRSCRLGEITATEMQRLQAIVSGMNELPGYEGPAVRGLGFDTFHAASLTAAHYEPGQTTIETSLTSMSMREPDSAEEANKFTGGIEMHIESRNARRLMELASEVSEREAVLMPMSQLYVHRKEIVHYEVPGAEGKIETRRKWVIHAEEVLPGDPRYVDPEQAGQQAVERQDRARADEALAAAHAPSVVDKLSGEAPESDFVVSKRDPGEEPPQLSEPAAGSSGGKITGRLEHDSPDDAQRSDGAAETAREPAHSGERADDRGKITRMMEGDETPYSGQPSAHGTQPAPEPPEMPAHPDGNPDWRALSNSIEGVHDLPAIHAGTAHPEHGSDYIAENHPGLREVNPNFHDRGAFENGWQTNCTRCVVNYAKALIGRDEPIEPVLPEELAVKGTKEYVGQNLGGQWEDHGTSYDSVIHRMRGEPAGSHAVVGVTFPDPSNPERTLGHVAMVANTSEGVAFIDPQSGRLMDLPYPPRSLELLPFGTAPDQATDPNAGLNLPKQAPAEPPAPSESSIDPLRDDSDGPVTADLPIVQDDDPSADQPPSTDGTDGAVDAESSGKVWRQEGPWFGQHVNPFSTVPPEEEDYELGAPVGPDSVPEVEGRAPSNPGMPQAPRSPAMSEDFEAAPGRASGTATSGAGSGVELPEAPEALSRSMSGDLGPMASPLSSLSESGALPAAGTSGEAWQSFAGSTGSAAASADPASTTPEMGTPGASAASSAGQASGGMSGTSGSPEQVATRDGSAAGAQQPGGGGAPSGAMPGSGSQGGSDSTREPRGRQDEAAVTHNREEIIPADVATMYLRNQDTSALLAQDGRQVLFRRDAAVDLGPGQADESPVFALKLRYQAADPTGMGVPFEEGTLGPAEFTGEAEIYGQDADGAEEVLLGTFDRGTGDWAPTPAGIRWLDSMGA